VTKSVTPWQAATILAFSWALLMVSPSAAQRCNGEPWAQLGFLVGEWRLTDADGGELGSSNAEWKIGGCALVERWTVEGVSGETVIFRDLAEDVWRMVAIGDNGVSFAGRGETEDGVLRIEGVKVTPERDSIAVVETVQREADGSVRWRELTPAGEPVFEVVYWPPTRITRATPSEPEPAPKPAPISPPSEPASVPDPPPVAPPPAERSEAPREVADSDVRVIEPPPQPEPPPEEEGDVRSLGREARGGLTQVESPMILQFPVGPVESLPRGYSWRTAETARFECEKTRIERVGVEREQRRGQVELTVSLEILGDFYLDRVSVGVELLDGETVVADAGPETFSVGRSLPAVVEDGVLIQKFELSLSKDEFERLFSGDPRPELRITLTAL
jgi:hypothetical protein